MPAVTVVRPCSAVLFYDAEPMPKCTPFSVINLPQNGNKTLKIFNDNGGHIRGYVNKKVYYSLINK